MWREKRRKLSSAVLFDQFGDVPGRQARFPGQGHDVFPVPGSRPVEKGVENFCRDVPVCEIDHDRARNENGRSVFCRRNPSGLPSGFRNCGRPDPRRSGLFRNMIFGHLCRKQFPQKDDPKVLGPDERQLRSLGKRCRAVRIRRHQGHFDRRTKERSGGVRQRIWFVERHDPDMDPGRVEFQSFWVEGQDFDKAGDILLGKRLPPPEPVRKVRRMEPADAGPIESRSVGQIDQYSCES